MKFKTLFLIVTFATSLFCLSMDLDPAHLEQQLLRFEEELYAIPEPRTPILLREDGSSTDAEESYKRKSDETFIPHQGLTCEACGVLSKNRQAQKRHLEFCDTTCAKYLAYHEKLRSQSKLFPIQPATTTVVPTPTRAPKPIAATTPQTTLKKKRSVPSFCCKFCNHKEKTLNAFKMHLCFNHDVLDNDVRPFQKPNP
jgi:hypothetical protein